MYHYVSMTKYDWCESSQAHSLDKQYIARSFIVAGQAADRDTKRFLMRGDMDRCPKSILFGPTSSSFLVTSNCHDALRRLRHKKRIRVVWIDALCIDQKNIEE